MHVHNLCPVYFHVSGGLHKKNAWWYDNYNEGRMKLKYRNCIFLKMHFHQGSICHLYVIPTNFIHMFTPEFTACMFLCLQMLCITIITIVFVFDESAVRLSIWHGYD